MTSLFGRFQRYFTIGVVSILIIYFGLSGLFVLKASLTDFACPGKDNLPTEWYFPDKIAAKITLERYPMLDRTDWQLPSYQTVVFKSKMPNVDISAWYTKIDRRAPVVIVVHGIRPNCKNAYESLLISGMLARGGINVLNIDLQNHGDSSKYSNFIAYGQREYLDLLGAYDWLRSQGFQANQIGLAGLSLGAVTSAIAFSKETDIRAVWLDSPFSDFDSMFCYELNKLYLPCFFRFGVEWIGQLLLGISPNTILPIEAISDSPHRYIFLTHGMDDTRIPFSHAQTFLSLAQSRNANIDVWFVEDSMHLEAMLQFPRTYQKKLVKFFKTRLATVQS
tara:strand:- start:1371 stop:2375 length:1005 start_codon:yes stop_codon:yes gene_type:complete